MSGRSTLETLVESRYPRVPLGAVTVGVFARVFVAAALDGQFEALDRQQDRLPDDE